MLNYNWNILGCRVVEGTGSQASSYEARFLWDYDSRTVGVGAPNMDALAYGVYNIVGSGSNVINIVEDAGGTFVAPEDSPYTASLIGSGSWPVTGSTTMSLYIAGPGGTPENEPYYFFGAVSCSAAAGNISTVSGSTITNSFTSSKTFIYFASASIVHHKGNEYNPTINWVASASQIIPQTQTFGNKTTFNIYKDKNVLVYGPLGWTGIFNTSSETYSNGIDGVYTGTFQNDYAFNITASLTGAADWANGMGVTQSLQSKPPHFYPTMSLSIPEVGINLVSYTTQSLLTASFAATTNSDYNIIARVQNRIIPSISASVIIVGGGGCGAGGGSYSGGGGGGGGAIYTSSINLKPNYYYYVNQLGTGSNVLLPNQVSSATLFTGWDSSVGVNFLQVTASGGTDASSGGGYSGGQGGVAGNISVYKNYSSFITVNGKNGGSPNASGAGGGSSNATGGNAYQNPNNCGTYGGVGATGNVFSNPAGGYPYVESSCYGGGGAGGSDVDGCIYNGENVSSVCGGGAGGGRSNRNGSSAAPNTGGGGGGAASQQALSAAGSGADGIVIIRYYGSPVCTGGTITEASGYTYHTFTTTGSFIYAKQPYE
jgi:hypothetical protein